MAHIDIFKGDAFSAMTLGEAVRLIPNQWGLIGNMGLFGAKPIRGTVFSVEMKNGVIQLVQSSERGTPIPGQSAAGIEVPNKKANAPPRPPIIPDRAERVFKLCLAYILSGALPVCEGFVDRHREHSGLGHGPLNYWRCHTPKHRKRSRRSRSGSGHTRA